MPRTRRNLWINKANYRRIADADLILTPSQVFEALIAGYAAGHITLGPEDQPVRGPGKGRMSVAIADDMWAVAERLTGDDKDFTDPSPLLDALLGRFLKGDVTLALAAANAGTSPRPALTVEAPPAEGGSTS